MTDLPSREKFNEQYPDDWPVGWRDVLDAWSSGRLVDREAIDYGAATDQLGLIDWIAMQTKHPSSVEMPPYEWLASEAHAVVDAAIGGTG